jgi:deglycase
MPRFTIEGLKLEELLGLVITGGWAPYELRCCPAAINLVRSMNAGGRITGIICHGGLIAISAHIVAGHKATRSLGIEDDLVNAATAWVDESAFRDGNQVWGRIVGALVDSNT